MDTNIDIPSDHIRREAKATQGEQKQAMRSMREMVARLFNDGNYSPRVKSDLVLGGFDRRRFLSISGVTVVSAAVLAACGGDDDDDTGSGSTATTAAGGSTSTDITILRTASSLERLAVDLYNVAIGSGLVTDVSLADAARLFRDQHEEHAELFEGATSSMGGQPFTEANPAVLDMLQPTIAGLRSQLDVVKLAYDVEAVAAATYFSTVGAFDEASLNKAAMSVGGVEARHVAILGTVLILAGQSEGRYPQSPSAGFQTNSGAVAAGTGV